MVVALTRLLRCTLVMVIAETCRSSTAATGSSSSSSSSSSPSTANGSHVKYLGWYMENGKGLFNQSHLNAAPTHAHANIQMASNLTFLIESSKQLGLPGLLNLEKSRWANTLRDRRPDAATNAHIWSDTEPMVLSTRWEVAVDDLVQTLRPLAPAHANRISGVMIGDELVCGHFPLANLSVLASKLHDSLSGAGIFIFTNECFRMGFPCKTDTDCATQGSGAGPASCRDKECHAAVWPEIPAGLDYISCDVYSHGAKEAILAQQYAEKFFFPLLKEHQSVWLVPGMFGRNGTKDNATAMEPEDDQLLQKLHAFWQYAQGERRITGLLPWHWGDLGAKFHPSSMALGGSDFPKTMAQIAEIRKLLPKFGARGADATTTEQGSAVGTVLQDNVSADHSTTQRVYAADHQGESSERWFPQRELYMELADVGIIYDGWHTTAYFGRSPTTNDTVEEIIRSNGTKTMDTIGHDMTLANGNNGFWHKEPIDGFYCIYRKRPQDNWDWHWPLQPCPASGCTFQDCPNIRETTTRHARQLIEAGIDFVIFDATNEEKFDWQGDATQLRPFEVLCEEWLKLRQAGIRTPTLAIWQNLKNKDGKATLYKHYLNNTYADGSPFEELLFRDEKSGKKVFFTVDHPSPQLIKEIESSGKIVVQQMWEPLQGPGTQPPFHASTDEQAFRNGSLNFFSPCRTSDGVFTPSISSDPTWSCNQSMTTNATIGRRGTSITVSGGYQVLCASIPLVHSGKLGGLTLQKQFHTAMQWNARRTLDYLIVGTFNEHIAGHWRNSFEPSIPWCVSQHNCNVTWFRPVGMETDAQLGSIGTTNVWVDIYGDSYTRDLEPTKQDGGELWNLFRSCMRVFKSGAGSCANQSEPCCQYPAERRWVNVWSLKSGNGSWAPVPLKNRCVDTPQPCPQTPQHKYCPNVHTPGQCSGPLVSKCPPCPPVPGPAPSASVADYMLTANKSEAEALIAAGTHEEICTPAGGSTAFCHFGSALDTALGLNTSNTYTFNSIRAPNHTVYTQGPFVLWESPVSNVSKPCYRCITSAGRHFVSATKGCLDRGKVEVTLGHLSVQRTSNTPRSLRLCEQDSGVLRHSTDGACESTGAHTLEHLGFVH
jgi:hypothetical protein